MQGEDLQDLEVCNKGYVRYNLTYDKRLLSDIEEVCVRYFSNGGTPLSIILHDIFHYVDIIDT